MVATYAQGEAQVFEPGQVIDRRQVIGFEPSLDFLMIAGLSMAIVTALAD